MLGQGWQRLHGLFAPTDPDEMFGDLVADICGVEISLADCLAHVPPRSHVVLKAFVPLVLCRTEITKSVQDQPSPHGFPVILAQSTLSARQAIQEERVALFKLVLRKESPAQVGLTGPGNVVAESFANPQRLLEVRLTFLVPSILDA